MRTTLIRPTRLRVLLKADGKRVSRRFIESFDASVVALARSYARIHDGARRTLMADLLEIFPVRRGFHLPEKKRRRRAPLR
jgi:hypothetical protein